MNESGEGGVGRRSEERAEGGVGRSEIKGFLIFIKSVSLPCL